MKLGLQQDEVKIADYGLSKKLLDRHTEIYGFQGSICEGNH